MSTQQAEQPTLFATAGPFLSPPILALIKRLALQTILQSFHDFRHSTTMPVPVPNRLSMSNAPLGPPPAVATAVHQDSALPVVPGHWPIETPDHLCPYSSSPGTATPMDRPLQRPTPLTPSIVAPVPPPSTTSMLRSQAEFFMTGVLPVPAQLDVDCSTCLDPLAHDVVKMAKCGHIFHCTCIIPWFQGGSPRRGACPNCRAQLFVPEPLSIPPVPLRTGTTLGSAVPAPSHIQGFLPRVGPLELPLFPRIDYPGQSDTILALAELRAAQGQLRESRLALAGLPPVQAEHSAPQPTEGAEASRPGAIDFESMLVGEVWSFLDRGDILALLQDSTRPISDRLRRKLEAELTRRSENARSGTRHAASHDREGTSRELQRPAEDRSTSNRVSRRPADIDTVPRPRSSLQTNLLLFDSATRDQIVLAHPSPNIAFPSNEWAATSDTRRQTEQRQLAEFHDNLTSFRASFTELQEIGRRSNVRRTAVEVPPARESARPESISNVSRSIRERSSFQRIALAPNQPSQATHFSSGEPVDAGVADRTITNRDGVSASNDSAVSRWTSSGLGLGINPGIVASPPGLRGPEHANVSRWSTPPLDRVVRRLYAPYVPPSERHGQQNLLPTQSKEVTQPAHQEPHSQMDIESD